MQYFLSFFLISFCSVFVSYCSECKCNVCKKCDCAVFHLSYQESLWDEEKSENKKKTKSKQRKQKQKEKLKLASASISPPADQLLLTNLDNNENHKEDGKSSAVNEEFATLTETVDATDVEVAIIPRNVEQSFEDLFPEDGFDDDDGNLVDFLESTGSILALADKLGIK